MAGRPAPGDVVDVVDARGEFVGRGYCNRAFAHSRAHAGVGRQRPSTTHSGASACEAAVRRRDPLLAVADTTACRLDSCRSRFSARADRRSLRRRGGGAVSHRGHRARARRDRRSAGRRFPACGACSSAATRRHACAKDSPAVGGCTHGDAPRPRRDARERTRVPRERRDRAEDRLLPRPARQPRRRRDRTRAVATCSMRSATPAPSRCTRRAPGAQVVTLRRFVGPGARRRALELGAERRRRRLPIEFKRMCSKIARDCATRVAASIWSCWIRPVRHQPPPARQCAARVQGHQPLAMQLLSPGRIAGHVLVLAGGRRGVVHHGGRRGPASTPARELQIIRRLGQGLDHPVLATSRSRSTSRGCCAASREAGPRTPLVNRS